MSRIFSIVRPALCALAIAILIAHPVDVLARGGGGGGGGGGHGGGFGGGGSGFSGGGGGRGFTSGGSGFGGNSGFSARNFSGGGSGFSARNFSSGSGIGSSNFDRSSGFSSRNFSGNNIGASGGFNGSGAGNNGRNFSGFGNGNFGNGNNGGNLTRGGAPSFSSGNRGNFQNGNGQNLANLTRGGSPNFNNGSGSRNFSSFNNNFHNSNFNNGNFHNTNFNGSFSHNWQSGHNFSQFHGNNFNHFNNFCHRGGWWGVPFCFPWSWGWFGGFGWGWGGYGLDYYSYVPAYCYDTGLVATVGYNNGIVADNALAAAPAPLAADAMAQQQVNPDEANARAQTGGEFFAQAENAFQTGKYRDSFRLANHAAIESPENPRAPELMSLSLFAMGEFPAAAAQAHFALDLGPPTDWASIYGYYGDANTYTKHLRALEKYSDDNPQSAEGHFLLAYHYLMTGYTKQAVKELGEVVKLAPNDKLSAALLNKFGGGAPKAAPPAPPAPGATKNDNEPAGAPLPPQNNPPDLPVPAAQ